MDEPIDEPIDETEIARRLTIQQAEEFKGFINDKRYPTFVAFLTELERYQYELWLSPNGDVDSYAKQLRTKILLFREIRNTPEDFIRAGKKAEADTGAVT